MPTLPEHKSKYILIISNTRHDPLKEKIFERGYIPILKADWQAALASLHHNTFHTIIIDRKKSKYDTLELILNVRDFDSEVRILVFGMSGNIKVNQVIEDLPNVELINHDTISPGSFITSA
jgi:PleD family two-component response regulator